MKRLVVGILVTIAGALVLPPTASAHTDFDYSLPTQDASVAAPISEITVAFTEPVTLVGNGFEVLDPQGEIRLPTPITDDDQVFRLILDRPVAGGEVGVRYEVTSVDGHVVQGAFSFVVDAPVPTTAPPTVPPTLAPTVPPITTPPIVPATSAAASTSTAVGVTTTVVTTTTSPTTTSTTPVDGEDDGTAGIAIAIALIVAVGAVGFVVVRSRNAR